MRGLSLALRALAVVWLLVPLLRRLAVPPRPAAVRSVLVKDPVCQTYVVRSRAVSRQVRGRPVYFCSVHCARRWP